MTTKIQGVSVTPLRQIVDGRGAVLHVLRSDDSEYLGFGECYCSETLPGAIKAWKRHKLQTQSFAVPVGRLRLVVFDDRLDSPTRGIIEVLELGRPSNYVRVGIAPGLWYGFQALGKSSSIIVNCVNYPHDPSESERLSESSEIIPYRWTLD